VSSVNKSSCEKLKTSVTCIKTSFQNFFNKNEIAGSLEHDKFRSNKYSNKPLASLVNGEDVIVMKPKKIKVKIRVNIEHEKQNVIAIREMCI